MSALTNALENKLIDWMLRAQAFDLGGATAGAGTGFPSVWVSLHTSSPSDNSNGAEVTGSGYARQQIVSSLANWAGTQGPTTTAVSSGTNGTTGNNATITFPTPGANWGTIVAFGIWSAVSGGTLLMWGPLTTARLVSLGDAGPIFPISALSIQIDN